MSVRPSVRLFVTCLYCDDTKWCIADILIPHERAITLVFWHQHGLVGDVPFPVKYSPKVTHPFEKCRLRDVNMFCAGPRPDVLQLPTIAQWTFWTFAVARSLCVTWSTCSTRIRCSLLFFYQLHFIGCKCGVIMRSFVSVCLSVCLSSVGSNVWNHLWYAGMSSDQFRMSSHSSKEVINTLYSRVVRRRLKGNLVSTSVSFISQPIVTAR